MDPIFFCGVPVGCVLVSGLILDARQRLRDIERDRKGWSDYAARRGLHYSCTIAGRWVVARHLVEGRVRRVDVVCATRRGILDMPTTTVTGMATSPIEGRLYVSRAAIFSQAQRDVAARRIEVAESDFNGPVFVVYATVPALIGTVFVAPVRELLLRMSASGRQSLNFRCEREKVIVEWLGTEALPDMFDLACDVVVGVCEARMRTSAYR